MKISRLMLMNIIFALLIQGIYFVLYDAGNRKMGVADNQIQLIASTPSRSIYSVE